MKFCQFRYKVYAQVRWTIDDIVFLIDLAKHHYDGKCQDMANEDGYLAQVKRTIEFFYSDEQAYTDSVDFDILDTVAKITEFATPSTAPDTIGKQAEIHHKCITLMHDMNSEHVRLNDPNKTT